VKTKGATDVHILENVIHPGGTFGWHSHPGPPAALGSTFIDAGHDLHMVRNNGTADADVYVISFVPAGINRRIDAPNPNPSACPD
jgi:hypothetical protein